MLCLAALPSTGRERPLAAVPRAAPRAAVARLREGGASRTSTSGEEISVSSDSCALRGVLGAIGLSFFMIFMSEHRRPQGAAMLDAIVLICSFHCFSVVKGLPGLLRGAVLRPRRRSAPVRPACSGSQNPYGISGLKQRKPQHTGIAGGRQRCSLACGDCAGNRARRQ